MCAPAQGAAPEIRGGSCTKLVLRGRPHAHGEPRDTQRHRARSRTYAGPCQYQGRTTRIKVRRRARPMWTHWDLNPGPSACEADVIPLHHVPSDLKKRPQHRPSNAITEGYARKLANNMRKGAQSRARAHHRGDNYADERGAEHACTVLTKPIPSGHVRKRARGSPGERPKTRHGNAPVHAHGLLKHRTTKRANVKPLRFLFAIRL